MERFFSQFNFRRYLFGRIRQPLRASTSESVTRSEAGSCPASTRALRRSRETCDCSPDLPARHRAAFPCSRRDRGQRRPQFMRDMFTTKSWRTRSRRSSSDDIVRRRNRAFRPARPAAVSRLNVEKPGPCADRSKDMRSRAGVPVEMTRESSECKLTSRTTCKRGRPSGEEASDVKSFLRKRVVVERDMKIAFHVTQHALHHAGQDGFRRLDDSCASNSIIWRKCSRHDPAASAPSEPSSSSPSNAHPAEVIGLHHVAPA